MAGESESAYQPRIIETPPRQGGCASSLDHLRRDVTCNHQDTLRPRRSNATRSSRQSSFNVCPPDIIRDDDILRFGPQGGHARNIEAGGHFVSK
jgi:hypothetical protein